MACWQSPLTFGSRRTASQVIGNVLNVSSCIASEAQLGRGRLFLRIPSEVLVLKNGLCIKTRSKIGLDILPLYVAGIEDRGKPRAHKVTFDIRLPENAPYYGSE